MHLIRLVLIGACLSAIFKNSLHQVLTESLISDMESVKDQSTFVRSLLNLC